MICSKYNIIVKWGIVFYLYYDCKHITIKRKNQKKDIVLNRNNDCYECTDRKINESGYAEIVFKGKCYKMHRFIYCLLSGKDFKDIKRYVLQHTCDNPLCCNPLHLIPGTQSENMRDMREKYRSPYGEKHCRAVLTNADTLSIYESESPIDYLAQVYSVTERKIKEIKAGKFNPAILNKG